MAQALGTVGVVVKNNVGHFDSAGVYQIGDGVTVRNVTPRTAADLAMANSLLATADVLVNPSDFADIVRPSESKARG